MRNDRSPAFLSALDRFFFAEETPFGMAIARILVPLTVGLPMWMRLPRVRELFSTDGTPIQMFELYGNGPKLPVLAPALAVPLYAAMLVCLLLASAGFRTRLSLLIATPLYIYFNLLDGVGTMTKYSAIGSHLLLLLTISNCGLVWSVDAMLRQRRFGPDYVPPVGSIFATRLMQLLFCFIYFGAAVTKIQTAAFFTGEQMRYWMLSNWNYDNPVGEAMAMWSWMLPVSAYAAVIWEVLFAFLVFHRHGRGIMLGLGFLFHFMTWLTLGLYIFPLICISGYFAFRTERDVMRMRHWLRRLNLIRGVRAADAVLQSAISRVPQAAPAGVVFAAIITFCSIAASEAERRWNLYGMQSGRPTLELQPLDDTVAQTMINGERRIREQDKFFSFELGTVLVGNQLANRRDRFTYGETMIAQCNLNPPHEDLWVECLIQDAEQRTIEQFGQIVSRDSLRSPFFYQLGNKLEPGSYDVVLKSANQEIYRRSFDLVGTPPATAQADALLTN